MPSISVAGHPYIEIGRWTCAKTNSPQGGIALFNSIAANCLLDFFVSMGLVIGGSLLGGVAALLTHHDPNTTMSTLASDLKVWAIVAALGGSMDVLRVIDRGVFGLHPGPMVRQFIYLVAAFLGCHVGYMFIHWLTAGREQP